MQLARVIGNATATVRHASLAGFRFVLVQPMDSQRQPDGDPLLAIDRFAPAKGQIVLIGSDGRNAREYVGCEKTPARWYIAGIVDVED
jgi:ethanolamine utilization protein EutN